MANMEKGRPTLFIQHYCLGERVTQTHIAIHSDNPCAIFKNYNGKKINACIFFQECSLAAHRAAALENLYKVACLGIGEKRIDNTNCPQYRAFATKILKGIPVLAKSYRK
jgi:hypothetical protein